MLSWHIHQLFREKQSYVYPLLPSLDLVLALIIEFSFSILLMLLQAAVAKREKEAQKKVFKKERKQFRTAMKVSHCDPFAESFIVFSQF